jgi:hypothetical protein
MLKTAIQNYPGLVILIPFGSPILLKVMIELLTGYALTVSRSGVRFMIYSRREDTSDYWWVVLLQVGYLCLLTWFCIFKFPQH